MTTNLNVTLSGTLQGELSQTGVFAYAVYFDTSGNPVWNDLVNNGTVESNGTVDITLPGSFNGGKVYFIVQSQTSTTPTLPNGAILQQSDLNWQNATTYDFRYDSFEVSLLSQPADAGNLSSVNGFGLPMGVSVPYDNGTTATVGYGISGTNVFDAVGSVNASTVYTYTQGPLQGSDRMALSPTEAVALGTALPTPPYAPSDWSSYVTALETALTSEQPPDIELSGLFNGAPDANSVWHNGGYFAYQLSYDGTNFWLKPTATSQIRGDIQISPANLENSIYSTLGSANIYTDGTDQTIYLQNMNTGLNNQWGKVLSELFVGFTGGFYQEAGISPNGGTVDLNQNLNWDPSYAFGQHLQTTPPAYQTSDPYSQVFYNNSNSYGSGYSDALMSQYTVGGPLISVTEPNSSTNVPDINLTIYADDEVPNPNTAHGYTVPEIYNYIAPPGGSYAIPNTTPSGCNVLFGFAATVANNAGMVLDSTDSITIRVQVPQQGGGYSWSTITFDGATAGTYGLWQNWNITFNSDTNSYMAAASSPASPQPSGIMLIANLPTAQNGVSWYQIGIGDKTFDLYTTTINGQFANPTYQGQQGDLAIDGLATITPQVSTTQTIPVLTVNFSVGDTVTYDPSTLVPDYANAGNAVPFAPVVGVLNLGTFAAVPNQTGPVTNTASAAAGSFAFGWTGDNPAFTSSTGAYTNKIDGDTIARVTIIGNGTTVTTTGTADIDGQWQTGTVDLGAGVYTVTLQEFLPSDTNYAQPLTAVSNALTLTLSNPGVANNNPCFLAGTAIRTVRGDVAVEKLVVGDLVLTASGDEKPITWIGRATVLAPHGRRSAATPVVVRQGALGANVPDRDLYITKGHALYLDGFLIPIEFLINHHSIAWADQAGELEIYHVELARHDVLLANGAPAETYRDDGNRWLFRNGDTGADQADKPPYAPVLTGGPIVDAIWRRLLERSRPRQAVVTTGEPDLHLLVDGRKVTGRAVERGRYEFRLTARPHSVHIVSRAAAQDELGVARDPRVLGVAIGQIVLWRGKNVRLLPADIASLSQGFHAYEDAHGFRWTNGNARLPSSMFDDVTGACVLVLHIACTARYPELPAFLAAAA